MALDNFVLQNTNPLEAYLQGAGGIQTLQNNQQVMQMREQQMNQAQQAQALAQQQAQAAQAALIAKQQAQADLYRNFTPAKAAQYQTAYPDDYKAVESSAKLMRDEERSNIQGVIARVTAANASNRLDLGQAALDSQVQSLENSGASPEQIATAKYYAKRFGEDPKATIMELNLASRALDPSTYDTNNKVAADTAASVGEEGRKAELQPLEVEAKKATTEKIREETRSELQKRGLTSAQIAKTQVEAEKQLQELGLEGGGKAPTEGQAKANLFGTRAKDAAVRLNMLELDPANIPHVPNSLVRVANFTPTVLGGLTEKEQSYLQYKRDFINAVLRRESGAAIVPDEFDSAELQYFPQLGEGTNIVRQKAANRKQAADLILAEAGSFAGKGATPSGAKTATKASIIASAKAHGVDPLVAMKNWKDQGNIIQ